MWVVASSGFSWMPAALHSFSVEGNCEFPKLKVGMAADELAGRTGTLSEVKKIPAADFLERKQTETERSVWSLKMNGSSFF